MKDCREQNDNHTVVFSKLLAMIETENRQPPKPKIQNRFFTKVNIRSVTTIIDNRLIKT
jgi:hypothetical protein